MAVNKPATIAAITTTTATKFDSIIDNRNQYRHHTYCYIQHNNYKHSSTSRNMIHLILLLAFFSLSEIETVKIVRHSIGQSINGRWTLPGAAATAAAASVLHPARKQSNSHESSILLDCDYIYDPGDVKLVVRWFFNDSPEPIYQWIPESDKRYIGELIRSHFDIDFQIGNDRFTKYRALRLIPAKVPNHHLSQHHHYSVSGNLSDNQNNNNNPTNHHQNHHFHHNSLLPTSLSGNYTCVISSIMSQDSRQGQLIVYVPPKKFEFNFLTSSDSHQGQQLSLLQDNSGGPVLRCTADQVYPKPLLTFSELSASANFHQFPAISVNTELNQSTQLYQSWFEHPLNVTLLKVGTVYECKLELPSTNFVRKKRIKLIYPSTYSYAENRNQDSTGESHDWKQRNWHQSTRLPPRPFGIGTKSDFQTSPVHKSSSSGSSGINGIVSTSTSGSMSRHHAIPIKGFSTASFILVSNYILAYTFPAISIIIFNCIQQYSICTFTYLAWN